MNKIFNTKNKINIPTNEEKNILTKMCNEFIKTINTLAEKMYNCGEIKILTTAKFQADLPSAVKTMHKRS
ncbi:hypothetical protein AN643_01485 [Candidatus Epulonipiscioides saccharophilum]|nr:hypothetical protein AN643_01485 [Epulopiscium sp. SCG-B10WGA-EpuloB]